jgi:hypothetical protein
MKKYLLLVLIIIISKSLLSQNYDKAVGIRGGISPGFEYRFYTSDSDAYKFLLSWRDNGLQLHALKEIHRYDVFDFSEQLVLFYGAGIHAGFESWNEVRFSGNARWSTTQTSPVAGIDGLAGVEYLFYEVPVSLGLEVKPYFELFGKPTFDIQLFDFAFTIKYLF